MSANIVEGNNNTADFSVKIRPINSPTPIWLHLKGTVLVYESYLRGEIIKRFVPIEKAKVIQNADVKTHTKDAWILLSIGIPLFALTIFVNLIRQISTKYSSKYLFPLVPLFLLFQGVYCLLRLKRVIGLRIEYDEECLYTDFPYQPGKNKSFDELLSRLSQLQKETIKSSPFQPTVLRLRVPLLKQFLFDPMLKGFTIGIPCVFILFSLKSLNDGIFGASVLLIFAIAILIFRLLDSFVTEAKYPRELHKARRLQAKWKYKEMIPVLRSFLKQNPSNTDAWSYLIQSQTRLGRYDEAHDSLNKMSSLPYANAYEIEKLNKQIQSWKIIIERMGGADPERIEPYKSALRIQNSY